MKATFGDRFKQLRSEKGLKQQELVDEFNKIYHYSFTRAAISQYENNKRIPEIDALRSFAEYFNVSLDYLMGITDIKNTSSTTKEKNNNDLNSKLSEKDERDIKKDLNKTLEQLEKSQDGLMFDGEPMDEETRELLRISLENSMRIAKQAAKKYTPKKYKK